MPSTIRRVLQVVGFLCIAAITGIIGNRADATVQEALPLVNQTVTIKLWAFMLLLLIIPSPAIYLLIRYKKALESLGNLSKLDDRLLRLLVKMRNGNKANKTTTSETLVEDFLVDILNALEASGSCGISVYRRDPKDSNYLVRWKSSSRPLEEGTSLKFFVGSNPLDQVKKPRGIAGKTFRDKETRVVHITSEGGKCVPDNSDYLIIREEPYLPPYQALIAVSITTNVNDDSESLGVLCLYTNTKTAFDSSQVQNLIKALAKRLSIIMLFM